MAVGICLAVVSPKRAVLRICTGDWDLQAVLRVEFITVDQYNVVGLASMIGDVAYCADCCQ